MQPERGEVLASVSCAGRDTSNSNATGLRDYPITRDKLSTRRWHRSAAHQAADPLGRPICDFLSPDLHYR
jgi:hypothetical protein